jgi:hypothetical protein
VTDFMLKSSVFWNVIPCSLVKAIWYFRRTCHFHLQDWRGRQAWSRQQAEQVACKKTWHFVETEQNLEATCNVCCQCHAGFLLTYGAEPCLRSCQLCSHSRTSQHFMEPKGALPCSQEPSTGPYPEPDWSSPYYPISKTYINIVHPPTSWSS